MPPILNTAQPNPSPILPTQAPGAVSPQGTSGAIAGMQTIQPPPVASSPTSPLQTAQQIITQNRQQGILDSVSMQQLQQQGLVAPPPKPITGGDITKGVIQSGAQTLDGLLSLGGAIGNWASGQGFQANADPSSPLGRLRAWETPQNSGQVAGNVIGDIAQFALPTGEVGEAAKGLSAGVDALNLADKYGQAGEIATQVLKYGAKPALEGIQGGIQTGLQQKSATAGLEAAPAYAAGSAIFDALTAGGKNVVSKVAKTFMGDTEPSINGSVPPDGGGGGGGTPSSTGLKGKLTSMVRNSTEQEWRDALNLPNSVTKKEAASGKDVVKLLTDAGIKPDTINDGRLVTDTAIQAAKTNALVADKALTTLLGTEPQLVPASDILSSAMSKLRSSGTALEQAQQYLQTQLSAFIKQGGKGVEADAGGLQLNLQDWNDIKGKAWTNVVDFGDPAKSVKNDVNNAIAKAIKRSIENNVSDLNIKALNSHIGDWWHAVDVLQQRNGAKVLGRGLTKVMAKSAGAVAGTILTHGLGGTIGGDILGGKVASFLTDSLLPMDIKMGLLKKLEEDPETAPLVKQAWDLVEKRAAESAGRLQLPAGQPVGVGVDTPNVPPSSRGQVPARGQNVIYAGPPKGPMPEPYQPNIKYQMVKPPAGELDLKKIPKIKLPKPK